MKTFDDFLKETGADTAMSAAVNQAKSLSEVDTLSAAMECSSAFTMALLKAYHEWLQEQLQQPE